jgi:hypothetical protein
VSNACGGVELNDELQEVAGRPGRDKAAHPSFPPSVHQALALPRNDRNGLAQDAKLVHWIDYLVHNNERPVGIHGPHLREPGLPQVSGADACVSLATDDASPWTYGRRPRVSVLADRDCRQAMDHLGKIFRLWAADQAALYASEKKCRKGNRSASPPHAFSLSSRCGEASDRNHISRRSNE